MVVFSAEREQEAIKELRERFSKDALSDYERYFLEDDKTLLRYLRARQSNLDKTETMLRGTLKWRNEMRPECITAEEVECEAQLGAIRSTGTCKDGRPLIVIDSIRVSPTTKGELSQLRHVIFHLERATRKARQTGAFDFIVFVRLEEYSFLKGPSVRCSLGVQNMLLNHYPERMGKGVLYRTPWVFNMMWRVINPILDERTRGKILFTYMSAPADVQPGGRIAKVCEELIGPDWRELTGCEIPATDKAISSGYDHAKEWATIAAEEQEWLKTAPDFLKRPASQLGPDVTRGLLELNINEDESTASTFVDDIGETPKTMDPQAIEETMAHQGIPA